MNERQMQLGRRVELRQERLRLAAEAEALRAGLRCQLPPEEEVAALDADSILQAALALNQTLVELAEVDRKLAVLARVLGD